MPSMWQRITKPDVLVFLDASYPVASLRGQLNWTEEEYAEQHRRLSHARAHADIYILTDDLTANEVQNQVMEFLRLQGLLPTE